MKALTTNRILISYLIHLTDNNYTKMMIFWPGMKNRFSF